MCCKPQVLREPPTRQPHLSKAASPKNTARQMAKRRPRATFTNKQRDVVMRLKTKFLCTGYSSNKSRPHPTRQTSPIIPHQGASSAATGEIGTTIHAQGSVLMSFFPSMHSPNVVMHNSHNRTSQPSVGPQRISYFYRRTMRQGRSTPLIQGRSQPLQYCASY